MPRPADAVRSDDPGATGGSTRSAAAANASRPPAPGMPIIDRPTPDVSPTQEPSTIPGAHRGGFHRLPTGPVDVTVESAPAEPGTENIPLTERWQPQDASALARALGGWALAFAILGLLVSLFVGWGFPIGILAIVAAIFALRRPVASRAVAVWAIAIGGVSLVYSAGWLLFAASQANLLR